ncbi:hypothetical protein [Streptomyces sp. NBC_01198]|uniref:hypothetical protein n=1 Tax=Streptomyces sp. NBC_01198 TaxID=2903769 RepID=UPI002E158931|nr:hypothetical protein OG702_22325 [Streptomyces sp. NBC_01198]
MSAQQPKVPNAGDGTVDPDNFHAEGTPESPVDAPATKPGTVQPDNFHAEGTKQ